ncbi:hypothetical protein YC2023_048285 [Brassica napus]
MRFTRNIFCRKCKESFTTKPPLRRTFNNESSFEVNSSIYGTELQIALGQEEQVCLPQVFVRGIHIGGVEEIKKLNDEAELGKNLNQDSRIPNPNRYQTEISYNPNGTDFDNLKNQDPIRQNRNPIETPNSMWNSFANSIRRWITATQHIYRNYLNFSNG